MEPTLPQKNNNINTPPANTPPNAFGSSNFQTPPPPGKSRKKLFITLGIIFTLLVITGTVVSIWTIQNRNNQLAQEARQEAEKKAKARAEAKAREGTVSDLNLSLEEELKQIQETNDRSLYNLKDRLKQEVDSAATVGTGNENGL